MSLPRRRILRKRAHFLRVRSGGQAKPGRFLLVNARRLESDEPGSVTPSMFGFVTSRHVGKAHERNLVRRRLRAIVRAEEGALASGFHVVIVARRGCAEADFSSLRAEWRRLARKVGLLPPSPPGGAAS
ncbi:MAG: ribonuclease P protein component [Verrucomicrobiales bacterium]